MSVSTALSRVTGFARTWAMAYALGRTLIASSYAVANNIPNMVFELVAGGIVSAVFVPIFIERWEQDSEEDAWSFASTVFNLTALLLSVVAVVGTVWAEPFVRTQTFRISPEEAELAVFFFRFFAVQIVFYGANAVMKAILDSQRRYFWPAIAPVFNNLVVIVTLLAFYVPFRDSNPQLAATGLAVGTSLAVFVMVLVLVPDLIRLRPRYSLRVDLRHPGLRLMGAMAWPSLLYVVANLVAVSFRNAYAFEVSPAGPATLLYAWMFYQLPYGVLSVALATAVFTELSNHAGRKEWGDFSRTFSQGFRATAILMIPMAAMLIALAEPLVTLYQAGRFTAEDVPAVAEILRWWGATLFFYAAFMFVLRTFYSLKDTLTPMIVNGVLTVVHVGLYAVLTTGIGEWEGFGLSGIPITDLIFYALLLSTLLLILRRRLSGVEPETTGALVRTTFAATVGGGFAYLLVTLAEGFAVGIVRLLAQLLVAGVAGLSVTYILAAVLGVTEVVEGWRRVRTSLGRGRRQ